MPSIDFKPSDSQRRRSSLTLRNALIASIAIGAVAIGSTLAANINLNSGGPVEFGQGVTQSAACDNNIVLTPFSNFVNQTGTGAFKFSGFKLSGVDNSESSSNNANGCANKSFLIKLYGKTGSALASYTLLDTGTSFTSIDGTFTNIDVSDLTNSSANFTVTSPNILSNSIYKITLESRIPSLSVSAESCNFNSLEGTTGEEVTTVAQNLISNLNSLTIEGSPEYIGSLPHSFNSFSREDSLTLGEGEYFYSAGGEDNNSHIQNCLNDLLDVSYSNSTSVTNASALTFKVSGNLSAFSFDWIFASGEGYGENYDVAAVIVDNSDFALLNDGKVIHINNKNMTGNTFGYSIDPSLYSPSFETWANKNSQRAIFNSNLSSHRITIVVGNTDDTSVDSALFISKFRAG